MWKIEEVYAQCEAKEQHRHIMIAKHYEVRLDGGRDNISALMSRDNMMRPVRKYSYCKKSGHTVDFCWDLYLKRKHMREKDYKDISTKKRGYGS